MLEAIITTSLRKPTPKEMEAMGQPLVYEFRGEVFDADGGLSYLDRVDPKAPLPRTFEQSVRRARDRSRRVPYSDGSKAGQLPRTHPRNRGR